jgi:hypothetical protein
VLVLVLVYVGPSPASALIIIMGCTSVTRKILNAWTCADSLAGKRILFIEFGSLVPSKGMSVKCGFAETGS